MSFQRKRLPKVSRRALRAVVDEVGPDDGVDPRLDARARARQHRRAGLAAPQRGPGRKALQLGRQVAVTLDAILAGEADDELLRGLRVMRVDPSPDTARLLVTLTHDPPLDPTGPRHAECLARLNQAGGWLRTEIAAAICRKRVPSLAFRLAPSNSLDSAG